MISLHHAIEHMDEQQVAALLALGADPNQPDADFGGFRPLHLAVDIECEEACRREDAGDNTAKPKATLTRILVNAGADPDMSDLNGLTARALAKERRHFDALRLFSEER